MISIEDFNATSFEKQCNLITTQTTYITSRNLSENKIYLYHGGNFFIEVYYFPHRKRVEHIRAFNNIEGLLPYVETVSFEDLEGL